MTAAVSPISEVDLVTRVMQPSHKGQKTLVILAELVAVVAVGTWIRRRCPKVEKSLPYAGCVVVILGLELATYRSWEGHRAKVFWSEVERAEHLLSRVSRLSASELHSSVSGISRDALLVAAGRVGIQLGAANTRIDDLLREVSDLRAASRSPRRTFDPPSASSAPSSPAPRVSSGAGPSSAVRRPVDRRLSQVREDAGVAAAPPPVRGASSSSDGTGLDSGWVILGRDDRDDPH